MLSKILRKIKYLKIVNNTKNYEQPMSNEQITPISKDIKDNFQKIKGIFENDMDINIHQFLIGKNNMEALVINMEGLSETRVVNNNILDTLMWEVRKIPIDYILNLENIKNYAISSNKINEVSTIEQAVDGILNGNALLFLNGEDTALEIGTQSWEHRGVEAPQTEVSVRGPRESFTETMSVNTSLVRRKIKNSDLKIEEMVIGKRTKTKICVVYLNGIVDVKILEEVRYRLKAINIDAILESGYIEDFIKDAPFSVFPTVGNTEVPDKFAAKILEGRVGILTEGTPIALTVPFLFVESLQVAEDYYSASFLVTQIRLLRLMSFHLAIFGPAIYIALTTFHTAIIPEQLLLIITATREKVPFPAVVEALLIAIAFEIIKEAAVRMPRAIGQAVSIVGALIMGEIGVNSGLVSPIMLIIISLSGIMSYLLPSQMDSITLLKFPLLIAGGAFGLFGVIWGYIFMIIHLASLRSFGVPYFSPIMPFNLNGMKDFIIRVPWWLMNTRPSSIGWRASERASNNGKPAPSNGKVGDKQK
ncbi:spore germination protein [Clostridium sp. CF012]|uniref:spore germination protein n=1 Tax=Clostridium sp. CF012 TaxID=2843319 RepID=UPI001C0B3E9D|nr:spore germination protein [Clostridium sp. CF012]MBU3142968.1 spore germination protein [Clostridium sp. CF012]